MGDILPKTSEEDILDKSPPEKIGRLGVQIWWLRPLVLILAIVIIGWLIYLEHSLMDRIKVNGNGQFYHLLAVTPIVSITAIVIFILNGVFRGYQDKDTEQLPLRAFLNQVSGTN